MNQTDTPAVPWSEEAEQAILAALLLQPEALAWATEEGLAVGHFHSLAHREIFGAIRVLAGQHQTVDTIAVFEHLTVRGIAEACGGLTYLNALSQSVASAAHIRRHASIVIERALRRAIIEAAGRAMDLARSAADPVATLDQVGALFDAIRRPTARSEPQHLGDLMVARSAHWTALEAGEVEAGLRTGFGDLDDALGGGLKPGRVIVIAARPSIGKTSFATQIGLNVAGDSHSTLMLSQEMQAAELVDRAAANLGRLSLGAISTGRMGPDGWTRATEAAEAAQRMPFFVDDQPALTLLDIRDKARKVKRRHGLEVLIVDYLQLCAAVGRQDTRHHQIEQISRGMKQLAKELDVCVLLLSQVNRASTARADGEPTLADLKESGAVEEDADTVIVLHPKGVEPDGLLVIAAILLKNRQGRRGRMALALHGETQRWFESNADVSRKVGAG